MKDIWYADNKDLVKWAVLCHLAKDFKADKILQIPFYRPEKETRRIVIDNQKKVEIPETVASHFRNIHQICKMESKTQIEVFGSIFNNKKRPDYFQELIQRLSKHKIEKMLVFLDPDTGLEPKLGEAKGTHVSEKELKKIWETLKNKDVLVFYQHQTNRRGKKWITPKKNQFANAIALHRDEVKIAKAPDIARDVVLFYTQKTE